MKRCEVCNEMTAKYKCPGCLVQTCSLPCVKQHKSDSGCSGQRDKTGYVAIKDFNDLNLLSDYRFLEDAGRKKDSVYRDKLRRYYDYPKFVNALKKQSRIRNINLRLMPYPMSKRKNNNTRYNFKSQTILWQIEWVFPQADTTILDRSKPETSTLESLLDHHIGTEGEPIMRHKLNPYITAGKKEWRLFMKIENVAGSESLYYVLDMSKSINDNLAHKMVIEYPTIYVVLKDHWENYRADEPVIVSEASEDDSDSDSDSCEEIKTEDKSLIEEIPTNQSKTNILPVNQSQDVVNQSQEVVNQLQEVT